MRSAAFAFAVVLTTVAIGCLPVHESDEVLLRNPSFHIMVNDEATIPESATYGFSTKVFKLESPEEFDLAEVDRRIVAAIDAELAGKDYRRAATDPEILVSFALAVDSEISAADLNAAYADDFPIEFPEMGLGQELAYHQGALIVDFVDPRSKKLLWRGAIFAGLDPSISEDAKKRRTREAVRILLGHFPQPIRESAAGSSPAAS